jgi:3-oxoadipate enol-lactonase
MFVTTNDGMRLKVTLDGPENGDPLLLLNSLGCTLSMWDAQVRMLATRFRVIRFDARGHGGSDAPGGDYTLARLGRDALAVLDAADAPRAHICGISLGGITAQWLAVHVPDRVQKLVLANTAARLGSVETWQVRLDTVLGHGMDAIADAVIGRFFSEPFRVASPTTVGLFRQTLLRTSPQGYAGCCAVLRDADLRADLREIDAPTLVIGGTHDVSTPLAEAETLAREIKSARLAVFDAAHLSNVEQPVGFADAIRNHLEAL